MHTDNSTPTIPTRIECGGCGLTLRLGWATGQVTAEVPSNGRKGQHYRPAHEVTNDTLTLDRDDNVCEWECPHCLYADSIDLQGHVLGAPSIPSGLSADPAWAAQGFTDGHAAMWIAEGFTADEAAPWADAFIAPAAARGFADDGLTVVEARRIAWL